MFRFVSSLLVPRRTMFGPGEGCVASGLTCHAAPSTSKAANAPIPVSASEPFNHFGQVAISDPVWRYYSLATTDSLKL